MTGSSKSRRDPAATPERVVFVIDDDEAMRETLSSLFRSVGLRVELFGSTREFAQTKVPDAASCLVLDIRLPGPSGLDFQADPDRLHDRPRRHSDVGSGHEGWCD